MSVVIIITRVTTKGLKIEYSDSKFPEKESDMQKEKSN